MQVAIAHMPKINHAHARPGLLQGGIGFLHKLRYGRYGQGNIVLYVKPALRLRQRYAFAHLPHGATLAGVGGYGSIAGQALL